MPYTLPHSFLPPLQDFLPTLEAGNDITEALAEYVNFDSDRSYLQYANMGPGYVYFHATASDLDTDGSGPSAGDPDHDTHLTLDNSINSNEVSYAALPAALADHLGIALGTVGVVVRNGIAITVIFADLSAGPAVKPAKFTAELSLYAYAELGESRYDGERITNAGMDGPLAFIWFPGTVASWQADNGTALPSAELGQAIHDAAVPAATALNIHF